MLFSLTATIKEKLAEIIEIIAGIFGDIAEKMEDFELPEFKLSEKEEHDTPYKAKYKRIFFDRRLRFPHPRSRCQNDPDHWKFFVNTASFHSFSSICML